MDKRIAPCDTMRVNLIAAAVGLQQCTKTATNIVPIPGGDRVIVIGTPAQVRAMLSADVDAARVKPTDILKGLRAYQPTKTGEMMDSETGVDDSGPNTLYYRADDLRDALAQQSAICQPAAPIDAMSDDHLWQIAVIVNRFAGGSLWNVSEYDCVTAIRASFMDPDSGRAYEKARAAALVVNDPDGLSPDERAFVELVRQRPGHKLNSGDALGPDGESLWKRPEELGLIECVGSYKWVVQRANAERTPLKRCAAGRDGECGHAQCPQLRDGEQRASGRHCPLDNEGGHHD